jgi:hypothetical protein
MSEKQLDRWIEATMRDIEAREAYGLGAELHETLVALAGK